MTKEETKFVFVYGTLKKGEGASRKLDTSEFIGEAVTEDPFLMFGPRSLSFPILVPDEAGRPVRGEVYRVTDPEVMASLDRYEGYPHFYTRDIFTVHSEGRTYEAWIYNIPGYSERNYIYAVKPGEDGLLCW